jgi:hypothetical protein
LVCSRTRISIDDANCGYREEISQDKNTAGAVVSGSIELETAIDDAFVPRPIANDHEQSKTLLMMFTRNSCFINLFTSR